MSDATSRSTTTTQYTQSPNFVILPADGAFVQATREQVNISLFVERVIPEVRNGRTMPKEVTREIRYEVRIPTTQALVLALQISGLIRGLEKTTAGQGVVFNAPPLSDEIAHQGDFFHELLTDEEKDTHTKRGRVGK